MICYVMDIMIRYVMKKRKYDHTITTQNSMKSPFLPQPSTYIKIHNIQQKPLQPKLSPVFVENPVGVSR